jgi:hypothetical protein
MYTYKRAIATLFKKCFLLFVTLLLPQLLMAQAPLAVTGNGSVGIGTEDPKAKLHVVGDVGITGVLDLGIMQPGREGNAGKIGYSTFDNGSLCLVGAGTNGSNRRLTFWNEGGAKFNGPVNFGGNITTGGNVGINTTNPNYMLDINGNVGLSGTHFVYNSQDGVIDWGNGNGTLYFRRLNNQGNINTPTDLALLNSNGMAIGNTNPYGKLDVSGNIFTSIHANEGNEHDPNRCGTTRIGMQAGAGADFAGMELETERYSCGNGGIVKFMTWGCNTSVSREVVRINENGWVGIGNASPQAPLHVSGFNNRDLVNFYFMFRDDCRHVANNNPHTNSISIVADAGVQAGSFYAMSDRRIKTEIKVSNNLSDLQKLKQIQVVDYNYKDYVKHGFDVKKGFIAQQVETVFPEAISKSSNFVPDIFSQAQKTDLNNGILTITLKNAHQLKTGDTVRIVTHGGETKEVAVNVLNTITFTVNNWTADSKSLFVYGKKVNDFRAVDYQQIFSMGISAIQELSKQVDELKAQNEALKVKSSQLENTIDAKLKALENKVDAISKPVMAAAK